MEKRLTRQQFINQFPNRVDISSCEIKPALDSIFEGVEVYRLLNILIIKLEGEYYCNAKRC